MFSLLCLFTLYFKQVDKSGMDEDEVKLVPQWRAKGISEIVHDEATSNQQLKQSGMTNHGWDDLLAWLVLGADQHAVFGCTKNLGGHSQMTSHSEGGRKNSYHCDTV